MSNIPLSRQLLSVTLLSLMIAGAAAQDAAIELPLTGPAYTIANEAYAAFARHDYGLTITKAKEALRLRPDVKRLVTLLKRAQSAQARRPSVRVTPNPAYVTADAAYKAYDRGDFTMAIDGARRAIKVAPSNPAYRLLLVNALLASDRLEEAEQAASQAIAEGADDGTLLARRGGMRHRLAEKPALAIYPAIANGKIDEAIALARQAVRLAPDLPAYQLTLIHLLLVADSLAEADQAASDAIATDNQDVVAWVYRGYIRQKLGRRAEAVVDFDQALQIADLSDEERRNVQLIVCDAALAANEPGQAIAALNALSHPDDPKVASRRRAALAAMARQKNPASTPRTAAFAMPMPLLTCRSTPYGEVCSLAPGTVARDPAYDFAMEAYSALAQKNYPRALSDVREAIQVSPGNLDYQRLLVNTLELDGQLVEAEQTLCGLITQYPDNPSLLAQRGLLRVRLGQLALAREDFSAALDIGNLLPAVEIGLLVDLDRKPEALKRFSTALENGALSDLSDTELAYLATRVGADKESIAAFERADAKGNLPQSALQNAAFAAIRMKHDAEAVAYFKRAIDAHSAGSLPLEPQKLFETQRAVAELTRSWGLNASLTYRGAGAAGTDPVAPGVSNDGLQAGAEVYWRPFGFSNGQFFEVFGNAFETLTSKAGGPIGGATLQGSVGARWKPLSDHNLVLSVSRLLPLGSQALSDSLAQAAFWAGGGTDWRVDAASWNTWQFSINAGRYFEHPQDFGAFSAQWGRSFRLDPLGPRLALFPHLVLAGDYNSTLATRQAVGIGPGATLRYWFRDDAYAAPRSYVDMTVQYRVKIAGDDRAGGFFLWLVVSY